MDTKIKNNIGPEEFGIAASEAEKARNYADFLMAEERKEFLLMRELAGGKCTIKKVIDEIGPLSLWSKDAFEREILKEREACAQMCKDKAKAIGARADSCGDVDAANDLKALAWQFNVMCAEIRMRSNIK